VGKEESEVMSKKTLTPKQNKFCLEYVIDYNGTRAAIRAGYSENTAGQIAGENLKKPEIQERIHELEEQVAKELSIEKADVYRMLLDVYYLARQERNLSVMGKAAQDIGKMIGAFVDRIDASVKVTPEFAESAERVVGVLEGVLKSNE